MTIPMPPLDPLRLQQLACDAEAMFERLQQLTHDAYEGLDRGDTDIAMTALIEREALLGQTEPLLRELLDARERLAGGSDAPAAALQLSSLMAALRRIAHQTLKADALLSQRLDAACASLASGAHPGATIAGGIQRTEKRRLGESGAKP